MEGNPTVGESQLTQKYFWGTHNGVGGGSYRERECSATTLNFVVREFEDRGLQLKFDKSFLPMDGDPEVSVEHEEFSIFTRFVKIVSGSSPRVICSVSDLHESVIRRYSRVPSWRPTSLTHLREDILRASRDLETSGGDS